MKLYKTKHGAVLQRGEDFVLLDQPWDIIINREGLAVQLGEAFEKSVKIPAAEATGWWEHDLLPPIGSQEVWAAGVTYLRSRNARMEESQESGGATFYDKVYEAERPELFFKSLPHRLAADGEPVYIRRDSKWNVPEPELTLFINSKGEIQGYTVGNDMSSRDIEGENPLYLPQAKVYAESCALGPTILISPDPLPASTEIQIEVRRGSVAVFAASTNLTELKRDPASLV